MLECGGARFHQCGCVPVAVEGDRNLPGMRVGFAAATGKFLGMFQRTAQCRRTPGAGTVATCRGCGLQRRGPCRGEPAALSTHVRSRRPDPRQIVMVMIAPGGGFCVWLDVSARGGDEAATVRPLHRTAACAWCPEVIWRAGKPTAAIPAPATYVWRWCRTVKQQPMALHRLVEIRINRRAP